MRSGLVDAWRSAAFARFQRKRLSATAKAGVDAKSLHSTAANRRGRRTFHHRAHTVQVEAQSRQSLWLVSSSSCLGGLSRHEFWHHALLFFEWLRVQLDGQCAPESTYQVMCTLRAAEAAGMSGALVGNISSMIRLHAPTTTHTNDRIGEHPFIETVSLLGIIMTMSLKHSSAPPLRRALTHMGTGSS